jgi:HlyD family secretion protein
VTTGPTNDKFFVIEQGLNEGDRIAVYPRGYLDQVALPKLPPQRRQTNEATAAKPATPPANVAKEDAVAAKDGETAAEETTTATPAAG